MEEGEKHVLYPRRRFTETKLNFRKVKLLHSGSSDVFRSIFPPEALMKGAICGLNATFIPKRGIKVEEIKQQLMGTAFFIAPGVAVTAWHVIEDFLPDFKNGNFDRSLMPCEFQLMSPLEGAEVLNWPIHSFSYGSTDSEGSDLTVLGCHLSGPQPENTTHHFLEVSERIPVVGEKLHILGLREASERLWGLPLTLSMFESVGTVIEVFPDGRGRGLRGPCFAISTGALGGMSGAPVFDSSGVVVGVLSTGVESQDKSAYSMISAIAPVLNHKINHSWTESPQREVGVRNLL